MSEEEQKRDEVKDQDNKKPFITSPFQREMNSFLAQTVSRIKMDPRVQYARGVPFPDDTGARGNKRRRICTFSVVFDSSIADV